LYRLSEPREIEELGLDELGEGRVLAIEWAEKLPRPPTGPIAVRINHGDGDVRQIDITNSPARQPTNYSDR
jgi:tRNA A37 threonylcarbamoyladenosine biosynthesis protein TsaE